MSAWVSRNRSDLAFVVMLTVLAGALRIYRLAEVPPGLHGDEALTGIDALRIVREGWIGTYVGSGLGQPAGPLYFTALVFILSEATLFTLHLSMALLGIATIPAAYFLFRLSFGRWVAVFATVALTFSFWHLFYSRSAFMLISMPLMTTLAAAAVLIALRSKTLWTWVVAGALLGLGVYTYNGYVMFLAVTGILLSVVLVLGRDRLRYYLTRVSVLAVSLFIASFPFVQLALFDSDFYFQRYRLASVLGRPEYQEAETFGDKVDFWTGRAWDAATLPLSHPEIDYSDGWGNRGAMDPILGSMAYTGLVIAIARWRSPPHLLMALAFVMGLGIVMLGVENQGELRRTLMVIPFVYGLAGIAAHAGVRWVAKSVEGRMGKVVAYEGMSAVLVMAAAWNAWTYFDQVVHEEHLDFVYATDLVDALDMAHGFDEPGTIYFYSDRWSYDYSTRRFLYPDTPGIDRSRKFGDFSLTRSDDGPVTYLFLPPYTEELDAVQGLHPSGVAMHGHTRLSGKHFSIYHLPEGPS